MEPSEALTNAHAVPDGQSVEEAPQGISQVHVSPVPVYPRPAPRTQLHAIFLLARVSIASSKVILVR